MNISKIIDRKSFNYEKYLCIRYFHSETFETALRNFCDLYQLKNLFKDPTCFKNPDNTSCIDLLLPETNLPVFPKINLTVLKMYFTKQKHESIFYRDYQKN